jgi:hypothetical protein
MFWICKSFLAGGVDRPIAVGELAVSAGGDGPDNRKGPPLFGGGRIG